MLTNPMTYLKLVLLSFCIIFLTNCSEDDGPEPAVYDASGDWTFMLTQTEVVDGDYTECGDDPAPWLVYTIIQDGNDVILLDKNENAVEGSVDGASYLFKFKEFENISGEDYREFQLKFKLTSENNCNGSYKMDERTFFTAFNMSFFCITEGTLTGQRSQTTKQ